MYMSLSTAQMSTREDMLAQNLGAPYIDDVMSHNELKTILLTSLIPLEFDTGFEMAH